MSAVYNLAKHELGTRSSKLPLERTVSYYPVTMLFMACFRPSDVLVVPYEYDEGETDEDNPVFQIIPFVSAAQALHNLKASKEFIVQTTKAGKIAEDYLDKAVSEWPRFKEDHLKLDLFDDWTAVGPDELDQSAERFKRMLSQGPGASRLLRQYLGYHTGILPYPTDTDYGALGRHRSDKRTENASSFETFWIKDSPSIVRAN